MVAVTVVWHNGRREGVCSVQAGARAMNRPTAAIVHTGRTESPDTRLSGLRNAVPSDTQRRCAMRRCIQRLARRAWTA
jgi:hypothetical protein